MRWTRYVIAIAAASAMGMVANVSMAQEQDITLSGSNEVPAINTTATGTGAVTINSDHTVKAKISVKGMTATQSHIHEAAAGANGPVIVPFVKTGDNTFEAPPGAKLTDAQYASYKAGKLYVNVHSAAHPGGELRGQLAGK